eukprot:scaffold70419_cov43-Prasinocladus_malaysianus.AAC.1
MKDADGNDVEVEVDETGEVVMDQVGKPVLNRANTDREAQESSTNTDASEKPEAAQAATEEIKPTLVTTKSGIQLTRSKTADGKVVFTMKDEDGNDMEVEVDESGEVVMDAAGKPVPSVITTKSGIQLRRSKTADGRH